MGTIIKNGTVIFDGTAAKADILIRDGIIAAIEAGIKAEEGDEIIDAEGKAVSYGLTDVHVHLRVPGRPDKETIASGSAAAAAGGYTCVCAMPNLSPVPDSPDNIAIEQELIDRDAIIDVLPYAAITKGRKGEELVDIKALKDKAVAFSDDGSGVQTAEMMRLAMEKAAEEDVLIAAHCEVNELLHRGYIHDGAYAKAHGHKGICSESEWAQVVRDLELSLQTGCRYHICHMSAAESVEALRAAKAKGAKASGETGPHYLLLSDADLQEEGRFKMNPPLRAASDRDALIKGILDGTIECIATDHAPHTAEEKSKGLEGSAMGIVGLETAFPLLYTNLVEPGTISLEALIKLMCENPRKIFRIGGAMRVGERADIAIFDLNSEYCIDSREFKSKGKATPFEGWKVKGRCIRTIKDGKTVYEYGKA